MAAGAALGTMSEAWWAPAVRLPGDTIDGRPLYRLVLGERSRPGSLIVDRSGRRFVDESQNYNDVGRALQDFDAAAFAYRHVPAWLVFDADYRRTHRVFTVTPDDPDPDWLVRADTAEDLAARIGVPPAALAETIDRFSRAAGAGEDPEFGRGSYAYDRFLGAARPARRGPVLRARAAAGLPREPRAARAPTRTVACSRPPTVGRSPASTPRATPRRARSGWPTPVPAARSARPSSSACARARRRQPTDPTSLGYATGGGGSAGRPSIAARRTIAAVSSESAIASDV